MIRLLAGLCLALAPLRPAPQEDPPAPDRGPSEEEIRGMAEEVTAALDRRDPAPLDRRFDWKTLLDTVMAGIDLPAPARAGFEKGFRSSAGGFGSRICAALGSHGTYRLLRVRTVGGERRALFRLLGDEGTVNYHEMRLAATPEGPRIVDVHIYASGELLTQTLRRIVLPMAADANRGLVEKLLGPEQDLIRHLETVREIQRLQAQGRPAEALKAYAGLPESLRRDKTLFFIRLAAAQQTGEEEYAAALKDLEEFFPGDPCLHLHSIDANFLAKRFDEARACIDRLDRLVDGDPYLHVLRGSSFLEEGNFAAGRKWMWKALEEEPRLLPAYWALVTASLHERDYKETARLLTVIEEKLGVPLTDLQGVPEYAGFVESEEYRTWRKGRPKEEEPDEED